ncbi:hypothetical protein AMATHDRAFT_139178 [Amanita thiersii Skay4041]|uniref:Tr-type G domain-containing protein n=1 Tax=Amanita thiersii Skay4041 TaxID=703135 RepID=A0A2A9NWR5_9AGAR|nr:hypothetical protein AMATHDRAFT_139178 [Amanita thiersii Skay4041]
MLLSSRNRITCYRASHTRFYSSRPKCDPSKLRNLALVAHIDSGKTTLTESILLKSAYLSVAGSVDTGSTITDFLPAERERGITIQSASIPVHWKDWTFNLIDTPGHADFGMEVESASRVVDGAVVLMDSVEGVESQTKAVWRQLDRYGVSSRIIFLNKLDRPGASFHTCFKSILAHQLHRHPVALTLPISSFNPAHYTQAEPGLRGLVDLVKWNIWKWTGEIWTCHPLPHDPCALGQQDYIPKHHPILSHLFSARSQLLENLAMFSDDLLELLLNQASECTARLDVPHSIIMSSLRKATLNMDIVPVVCGSAINHIGTELLLDYVGELLASPIDIPHDPQGRNPPVSMLAWKVTWDSNRGWMTFVRIYSGALTRHSTVLNTNRNQREKVSKILMLYASHPVEVDELPFGSVGVILGLKFTRTGDTLVSLGGSSGDRSTMRDITPPPAVISTSVIPHSRSDLEPVQEALNALIRTDPSVRSEVQEGQQLIHGLGALHLEIVENRLREEWKVHFEFGKRRVSYREGLGPNTITEYLEHWQTDVGGKRITVTMRFDVSALEDNEQGDPRWDGNIVLNSIGLPLRSPDSISAAPESYIARGIASALSNSPHTSLAMTRIRIKLRGYTLPQSVPLPVLSSGAAVILRNLIRSAGSGPILEPYILLKITVNEDSLGKVMKDITEHGGEVQDLAVGVSVQSGVVDSSNGFAEQQVYIPPQWLSPSSITHVQAQSAPKLKRSIHALAPLSRFLHYSARLRALSGGHGTFEMFNAGFRTVSDSRRLEILKEIGRA